MITIRRAGTVPFILIVILALCARDSFSFSQFANYQSTIKVNDIVSSGLKTWVACSGGLFVIDNGANSQTLFNDITHFPDVNLTAICRDPNGNLWIGSRLGYLYKQTPDGQNFIYNSYFGANWAIQALLFYKNYLLVGSSAGFSLFDPNKEQAIGNTSVIDTFSNQTVFTVAVHNDSLYLGCTDGFASACIAGDSLIKNNYADPSLWHSTPTGQKVASFIDSSGMFLARRDTAVFVGQTYYHANNFSDTFSVKVKDSVVFTFPSAVTKLIKDDFDNLWIGTEENYLYFWNHVNPAQVPTQVTIPGLTFDVVNRVYAAKNGTVWLEPNNLSNEPWFDGVTSFDGKTWILFSQYTTLNFGKIGDADRFHGLCEDRSANMWFGAPGGGIKRLNTSTGQWTRYFFAGWDATLPDFMEITDPGVSTPWTKCDAIAQDSSGFLWFANYGDVKSGNIKGSLICVDISGKNIKRFFPYGDQYYVKDFISLCVDSRGKILAGGHDGELLIASPNGNPLQNGIDSVYLFRTDFGTVSDICATSNGISWIATGKGLYKYNSLTEVLDSIPTSKIPATVTSVDAENDGVLWLGTSADGIMRYTVSDSTKTVFNMGNGLVSNAVNDLSIDKTGGYLWVATNAGLSRMSLGHTAQAVADNKSIVAYPNPFSRKNPNHREIIFKHCAPGAKINVYTLRGALVKVLSSDADNAYPFDTSPFETTLRWVPSKKLVPGMYYFIGQPQQPANTQKLLIVP
jgi:ligand-binding sensor domain-containing protein